MQLIADSGSTKVDWRAISSDGSVIELSTEGINPVFQTPDQIMSLLKESVLPIIGFETSQIFFYGAGIISTDITSMLEKCFKEVFNNPTCSFESDIIAAAKALCGDYPGIACIMGTGSNTCFYDGKYIIKNVKACGFILGDEGSGGVLGKRFIADYLKGLLPKEIGDEFKRRYELDYAKVVEKIYRSPFPSRFLASFSPFINEFKSDPHIAALIESCFADFFIRNIWQYDYKNYKVNIVGSIAYYYSDILQNVAQRYGVQLGKIIKSPIDGLVEYHKNL